MMAEWVFWIAIALVGYTYLVYPALTTLLARREAPLTFAPLVDTPALTVVIAAHNEAPRIADRIRDVLAQNYPADQLSVVVVDDGSDDGTGQAASIADPRVRVLACDGNRGKAAALNVAMNGVTTPIVVFADSRQRFAPGALRALAATFADDTVGGVSGELVLHDADNEGDNHAGRIGLYWRIEVALRSAEARLGWLHGVSGSIHAIRRDLYQTLPEGTILDDMAIPFNILLAGHRVTLAPDARAIDVYSVSAGEEFRRKLRTLAGNWQLMALYPELANPFHNPVFLAWFSHKFMRLIVPWLLLAALVASFAAGGAVYCTAFGLQVLAYLGAGLALAYPALAKRVPLLSTAGTFVMLNVAALVSLPAYLAGDTRRLWKKH